MLTFVTASLLYFKDNLIAASLNSLSLALFPGVLLRKLPLRFRMGLNCKAIYTPIC